MNIFNVVVMLSVLFTVPCSAHSEGEWTSYFPNSRFNGVIELDGDHIWCGTDRGLLRFDKQNESFTPYTTDDGLASNIVLSIAVDNEGVRWFGTANGLSRLDGSNWKTFATTDGLPSNLITAVAVDDNNILWIGTDNGLARFDGTKWKTYTTEDGLASNSINLIEIDKKGIVWVVMSYSVSCFDGSTWSTPFTLTPGDDTGHISSIAVDNNNIKWFCWQGLFGGPLMSYDDVEWTYYDKYEPYFVAVGSNNVKYFIVESKFVLFEGIVLYDGDKWIERSLEENLGNWVMYSLAIDKLDVKWIVTAKNLIKYDGENWQTYRYNDGTEGTRINTILAEPNGIKWFGAWNHDENGISRFDGENWTYINLVGGESARPHPNIVLASAIDSSEVKWFGTYEGVWRYDGKTLINYTTNDGLSHRIVRAIFVNRENVLWFGTADGLSRFDGENWTTYTTEDGLVNNDVWSIAIDDKGVMWFGTLGGISRFDGTAWKSYTESDGLISNNVRSLAIDASNRKWIGTAYGISCFDDKTWVSYDHHRDGILNDAIFAVTVDNNDIKWFGTLGGVSVFDNTTWKTITTDDGLIHNAVFSIAIASDDVFWFGTDNGVSRYNKSTLFVKSTSYPQQIKIRNYPNPFNASTTIEYTLSRFTHATVTIYNISGQAVVVLKDEHQQAGKHTITWNAEDIPSGLYFCTMKANGISETKKMLLLK
ncbi:MAG: T9SS type A sorting domain-containing protein [Candidatus Latescibacteria bacterium]|jgi:ligand-binding sensor domain-containing protein|nr:T9SS type A sorting domain-containing protein [Candidatus Latescibacterota bacterium]